MPSIRPLRTTTPAYRYRSEHIRGDFATITQEFGPTCNPQSGFDRARQPPRRARVLHIGSGSACAARLHPVFRTPTWSEIRVDVDVAVNPDIVASIVDLRAAVSDGSCDAVWASHVIEHVDTHDVQRALAEIHRVLHPAGFALLRCPDIEQVAQFVLDGRLGDVIYQSAAGPITPLDMIFGHSASIMESKEAMRHRTAFTEKRLADALLQAGFSEVRTLRTAQYEIWAAAFREKAMVDPCLEMLAECGTELRR